MLVVFHLILTWFWGRAAQLFGTKVKLRYDSKGLKVMIYWSISEMIHRKYCSIQTPFLHLLWVWLTLMCIGNTTCANYLPVLVIISVQQKRSFKGFLLFSKIKAVFNCWKLRNEYVNISVRLFFDGKNLYFFFVMLI